MRKYFPGSPKGKYFPSLLKSMTWDDYPLILPDYTCRPNNNNNMSPLYGAILVIWRKLIARFQFLLSLFENHMVLFRKLFFKQIGLEISLQCIKRTSMSQISWKTVPLIRTCKVEGSFTEMFQIDFRKL